MESGFGQNLEGFLIKGNLSLAPSANPLLQGDGSIEGSGTLYIDTINEYNSTNGVTIQDVSFKDGKIIVPYNLQSDNITSASVILNGGISIKHTQNSKSITSGGGLTVAGGGSFGKDLYIGGALDISGNKIKNVATPEYGRDGVNKDYVDSVAKKVGGNFTKGQVIIADSNGDAIRGYSFFTTDTRTLNLSLPFIIDNSLKVNGGIIAGGGINLLGHSITEVASPNLGTDAVNKYYVDNLISNLNITSGNINGHFTSGQLIVADTSGNTVRGYSNLLFNGSVLSLLSTIANSFVCYGGVSINKNVFIGGGLNVNNKTITNVATPILGTDAVNKDYLSLYVLNELSGLNITNGNISGNFTSGQLLIADTSGNKIRGYDNITFNSTDGNNGSLLLNNTNLTINDTNNAVGLTVLGGASIKGVLDVNLQNIKNVAYPVLNYDAVNKEYVDSLFANCSSGGGGGGGGSISTNIFNLNNNILVPEDIPVFYYPESILGFTASVYVQYNNENTALYTINGIHCKNNWVINSTYIGNPLGIKFFIRNNSGQGLLQYTNLNKSGFVSIRFSTTSNIDNSSSGTQLNINVSGNITDFTDIPVLSYPISTVDSFKLIAYVSSEIDDQCGMFFINSVYTNNKWDYSIYNIGDITGLEFNISSSGIIQYKNSNFANDYVIRVVQHTFLVSQSRVILNANTLVSQNINSTDLSFQNITNFQLSLVANDTLNNNSAFYEISGVLDGTVWKLNSRYIGDDLKIKFFINTISGNVGVLQYTNFNLNNVDIRFIKNIQNLFEPLSVTLGGTGNSRFTPYAILRGNGTNPIIGSDDFIYKDYQLTLGNNSSILLKNTENATSVSNGGTLTSYGGASFKKDVFIGGELDVNLKNIKNVADPVLGTDAVNKEYVDSLFANLGSSGSGSSGSGGVTNTFNLNNNVLISEDIPIFYYSATILAFTANVYIEYTNTLNIVSTALYTIRGLHCGNNWIINSSYIGDQLGIKFFIRNNSGQGLLQYTNLNKSGLASIRFSTTSNIDTSASNTQLNIDILGNNNTFTNITSLTFSSNTVDSFKLIIFVSSELDNQYGLFFINSVYSNNKWDINSHNIGDITGIEFNISSSGVIQYKNSNFANDYKIRVVRHTFLTSQNSIILNPNTIFLTDINTTDLTFQSINNFQVSLVANDYVDNKSALYEISGVLSNFTWKLNSRYIGDDLKIKFSINTISGNKGVLQYINKNNHNINIRYTKNIQNLFEPLSVTLGGTGNTNLIKYAVLRGNGINPIIGTDDFIYKDYQLTLGNNSSILLKNTENATSVLNGGALTSYGGASFNKDVFIGGELDVNLKNIKNVADPVLGTDAANKEYVDTAINNLDLNNNNNPVEQTFTLNNNIAIPTDIPNFQFSDTIRAFVSNIYVQYGNISALYTIRGINCNLKWILNSSLTGSKCGVEFFIRKENNIGYIGYTNSNSNGVTSIKYNVSTQVYTDQNALNQIYYTLSPNINVDTNIPILTFQNTILHSVKLFIYISSEKDNRYGLVLANCVLKNNNWVIHSSNIGNIGGIKFNIKSDISSSTICYTNNYNNDDYTIRVTNINILNDQVPVVLSANTIVPTNIDTPLLNISTDSYYFQVSIFVNLSDISKSALYEIQGVVSNNEWNINSRYIGDYTGIRFYITTIDSIGYITYTNNNNVDAYIRFVKDTPLSSLKPLDVNKGGTGNIYLNPYTILRGNGFNPIIGTNDLIYQNNSLIVGDSSNIIITNTSSTTNLTTGSTFVAYGGVSINKELFIGKQLVVKDVDITPNKEDISRERIFNAQNNVISPNDIIGFNFSDTITKSFSAVACVNIITTFDEFDALYEIKGLRKKNGWIIDYNYIGDNIGINFYIKNDGQIQYTSFNNTNWLSSTIKFRALTTSK